MNAQLDSSTFDLAAAKPKLRDDLKVSMKTEGGDPYCILEDSTQNRFFRIGFAEYTLLSLFDGKTTLAEAVKASSYILGVEALNEKQAAQICDWMITNGLAQTRASSSPQRTCENENRESRKKWLQWQNPLMVQMPIWTSRQSFGPDRFFESVHSVAGWLVSFFGAVLWMIAICCGVYFFASSTHDVQASIQNVFSSNQWVSLAVVGILLKIIHELAHGIACKRFGGQVSEVGVFWFLFVPLPYVDVSSSWSFDRGKRMIVAAAGILAELFVVSLAVVVWTQTSYGLINQLAAQTILLGSLVTVLFNANPLMRFDGYFLLSDVLRIPNLSIHGRSWVLGRLKKVFLGWRESVDAPVDSAWIPIYGSMAFLWQGVVISSILFAACNLMTGIGLLFVILGAMIWLLLPLGRFLAFLFASDELHWRHRLQFCLVVTVFAGLVYLGAVYLPSPESISIEVVARHKNEFQVRSSTSGFVKEVLVEKGQTIETGDPMLKLANSELELKHSILAAQRDFVRQEIRVAKAVFDIAQVEMKKTELKQVLDEIHDVEAKLDQLVILAPATGTVLSSNRLAELRGTFLHSGTEICQIVNADSKRLTGLVDEAEMEHLARCKSHPSQLIVWGNRKFLLGELEFEVSPSSTRSAPHFALTSLGGGQHTVVSATTIESQNPESWVMAKSRFEINWPVPKVIGKQLHEGQRCLVKVRSRRQSMGTYLGELFTNWARSKISLTHGI